MKVLVDTSIWSLALRRGKQGSKTDQSNLREELAELIREGRAQLIGPIRQELLAGIREEAQHISLRDHLRAFPDESLATMDFEQAASVSNRCRAAGIAGSAIDFLICAVAMERGWEIFTTDRDFYRYARAAPVRLYQPRG